MLHSPLPMHIPDGFLSTLVSLALWGVSAIAVGIALRRVGRELNQRQVPLMGVLAAAIFAGQMLNFTVAGGTSGHLLGAALATILVGPWAAVIVMTTVVSIQALVFQDGGLLALGANLFNMAIIGTSVAYFVSTSIRKLAGERPWGILLGGVAAAWGSIVVAALACALELALSGTSPANIAVPAMGGIHMLIGIGEALITLGALGIPFRGTPRPSATRPRVSLARCPRVLVRPRLSPCCLPSYRPSPHLTRMGSNGLPNKTGSSLQPEPPSTGSFPTTSSPAFRTKPWRRWSRALLGR